MAFAAAYSHRYGFKIGDDPRYTINVGPAIPVRMFKQLRENTERFAGQTKLRQVASGGYTMEGYVSGVPFPKLSGPLMPYQLLYNVWTYYFLSISYFQGSYMAIDRYGDQVRDVYILDLAPLPVISGYCYGHKVIFIDKETFVQIYFDDYDSRATWPSHSSSGTRRCRSTRLNATSFAGTIPRR